MTLHAEVLVYDGVDERDAIGPFEVLSCAARIADLTVALVGVDTNPSVMTAHGLHLTVMATLDAPDILVVPGGGWATHSPIGVRAEIARGVLPAAIAACHGSGGTVAAVCTGAMLLTPSGIVTGRSATTHHLALPALEASGARIVHARVVDDRDLVTAAGVTSGLDLALWIVERYLGAGCAAEIERQMEDERRGTVWRAGPSDAQWRSPSA
jgi:transcriptional regulator GlxA family with amidase domain